jgi:hypothetical protein
MIGSEKPVTFEEKNGTLLIIPPALTPDDHQPAYVFRLIDILN